MKIIVILFLTMLAARAADVNLIWDASSSVGVTNYIMCATNGPAGVRVSIGTNTQVCLQDITPGVWTFSVRAQSNGIESDPSVALIAEVASAPTNLRTLTIQYSASVTNFVDVGFFKLKVQ